MSRRNSLEQKRARRARKLLRKELPNFIDLVIWLKQRERMSTGMALKIIHSGWIHSESHQLKVRYVPATLRDTIEIRPPKEAK